MMPHTAPGSGQRLRIIAATLVGVGLLFGAGAFGLHALRNHAPDSLREIASPNGRFRLVITEEFVGFPGQVCIKDVYALSASAKLDRTDENARVFTGACEGLLNIRWAGSQVEATVDPGAATAGVAFVTLRSSGANGEVQVKWLTGQHPPPGRANAEAKNANIPSCAQTIPPAI